MTTSYEYVVADVFTATPLTGNQLAVFVDGDSVPDRLKQPLAKEIGFSETVYVGARDEIRIFTPAAELPFAGHPVLGTAYVLTRQRGVDEIELVTRRGAVRVVFDSSGRGRMTQAPVLEGTLSDTAGLLAALGGVQPVVPVDLYENGPRHLYVVLPDAAAVAALRPDFGALEAAVGSVGVNCVAGSGTAWKSRMFGPGLGVFEDPATGSAAGPLAVHLARHGLVPWGTEITITQGVEIGRTSTLYAVARDNEDGPDAVEVAGDTVVVGRGTFEL